MKIIRIITFSDYREHTNPLFKELSILPFEKIKDQAIALFTYRYFNRMLPVTFSDFFSSLSSCIVTIPDPHLKSIKTVFVVIIKSIPSDIKDVRFGTTFHQKL